MAQSFLPLFSIISFAMYNLRSYLTGYWHTKAMHVIGNVALHASPIYIPLFNFHICARSTQECLHNGAVAVAFLISHPREVPESKDPAEIFYEPAYSGVSRPRKPNEDRAWRFRVYIVR